MNPDNPAVYVSWDDGQALIKKLNTAAGDSLYRLPTEAELEYACRAGATNPGAVPPGEKQKKHKNLTHELL